MNTGKLRLFTTAVSVSFLPMLPLFLPNPIGKTSSLNPAPGAAALGKGHGQKDLQLMGKGATFTSVPDLTDGNSGWVFSMGTPWENFAK